MLHPTPVGLKPENYRRPPQTRQVCGIHTRLYTGDYHIQYHRLLWTIPQTTADHRRRLWNIPRTTAISSYHVIARRLHYLKRTQINNCFKHVWNLISFKTNFIVKSVVDSVIRYYTKPASTNRRPELAHRLCYMKSNFNQIKWVGTGDPGGQSKDCELQQQNLVTDLILPTFLTDYKPYSMHHVWYRAYPHF